jgi:hypothetical protein
MIITMNVYSNIPTLTRMTSLYDICQKVHQFKVNDIEHRPIDYSIRSIQELYPKNTKTSTQFVLLDVSCNDKIEQHFLHLSTSIKHLESFCLKTQSSILHKYLKRQLHDIFMRSANVKKMYTEELNRFVKLLIGWRHVQTDIS